MTDSKITCDMADSKTTIKIIVIKSNSTIIEENLILDIPRDIMTNGVCTPLIHAYMEEEKKCNNYRSQVCSDVDKKIRYEFFWNNHGDEANFIGARLSTIYGDFSTIQTSNCSGNCYIVKSVYNPTIHSRVYTDAKVNEFIECFNSQRKQKLHKMSDNTYQLKDTSDCIII